MTDSPSTGTMIPRSLFVYALLYGGLVVLAGVLGTKISEIGPLSLNCMARTPPTSSSAMASCR